MKYTADQLASIPIFRAQVAEQVPAGARILDFVDYAYVDEQPPVLQFIDNTVLPRPDTRYGVSKVFGEALGRLYADKYGLSVACLRIGSFVTPDRPTEARQLLTWISHRDMVQLVRRCIDHPHYHFVVVYGVSNNLRSRWDNTNAKFLGYRPQDDSEQFAAEILAQGKKEDGIAAQFHGGFYTPMEFAGDPDAIE